MSHPSTELAWIQPNHPRLPVASAPCSFGVDEIVGDDAWVPAPDDMLGWMAEIGYQGTELGPPGYLGVGSEVRGRLEPRGLRLVGAFLPQHFSVAYKAEQDRAWLRKQLVSLREATPEGSAPFAVLCEAIDDPQRLALSGAIANHPEAWLSEQRFQTLMDALHRAAELCAEEGFKAVIHPHAGTYLETVDEIDRLMGRLDASLVGLCLDTGHFRYGGSVPAQAVRDYASVLRLVHLKDCLDHVVDHVRHNGGGFPDAVARGVFTGLGEGDSGIGDVIAALRAIEYDGWIVVEQDQALKMSDTPESLIAGQRRNRDYLRALGV